MVSKKNDNEEVSNKGSLNYIYACIILYGIYYFYTNSKNNFSEAKIINSNSIESELLTEPFPSSSSVE